jgi:hypothetical protein
MGGQYLKKLAIICNMCYGAITKTIRRRGSRPANPEQPITMTLGFAASEADRDLTERLALLMGARSISAAIRGAIRNEFARLAAAQRVLR